MDNLSNVKVLINSLSPDFCLFLYTNGIVYFTGSTVSLEKILVGNKLPVDTIFFPKVTAYTSLQRNDGNGGGELSISSDGYVRFTPYSSDRSFSGFYFTNYIKY